MFLALMLLALAALAHPAGTLAAAAGATELDGVRFDRNRNVLHMPLGLIRRTCFPPQSSSPVEMKATFLKAYAVAWDAFQKAPEVPRGKKDLDRYLAVYVSEDAHDYYVYFLPKQRYPIVPAGETMMDGVTYFGQQALYVIRKSDYKIVKRTLYLL